MSFQYWIYFYYYSSSVLRLNIMSSQVKLHFLKINLGLKYFKTKPNNNHLKPRSVEKWLSLILYIRTLLFPMFYDKIMTGIFLQITNCTNKYEKYMTGFCFVYNIFNRDYILDLNSQ